MPNSRQWAILIWFVALAAWMLTSKKVRRSIATALRQLTTPKLLIPLMLMALYVAGLLVAGWKAGFWTLDLATDTGFWFVGSALVLFFKLNEASDPGFFRRTALATMEVTVFVEFAMNVSVFSLPVELILQPVLAILFMLAAYTASKPEYAQVKRAIDFVLGLAGFILVVVVVVLTIGRFEEIDWLTQGLSLALPVWLTLGLLPMIGALSIWSRFDHIYVHVKAEAPTWQHTLRGMTVVFMRLGFRPKSLKTFVGYWPRQLAIAETFQGARYVVADFLADQSRRQQDELERLERQKMYEGSTAVDEDGRRVDRRGFDETKTSLLTLASLQAGHFQRTRQYATGLDDLLPKSMAGLIKIDPTQIVVNANDAGDEYWIYAMTPANFYFGVAGRWGEQPTWLYAGETKPLGGIDTDDWRHVVNDSAHNEW